MCFCGCPLDGFSGVNAPCPSHRRKSKHVAPLVYPTKERRLSHPNRPRYLFPAGFLRRVNVICERETVCRQKEFPPVMPAHRQQRCREFRERYGALPPNLNLNLRPFLFFNCIPVEILAWFDSPIAKCRRFFVHSLKYML
jgi:hypothetical protein